MTVRIDYTIHFDRSWHIGSGEAAGRYLDSLVRRDALGLPFVPGSTIRGLVRDAVRKLAEALAIDVCDGTLTRRDGSLGSLCGLGREGLCPFCALTGSPHRESLVAWSPARLVLLGGAGPVWQQADREELAREAVKVNGLLARPHPRTAIDFRSGRAADEHLFTLEESLEGFELAGSTDIEPGLARQEVSLLVAALRFIREIGGHRRRGLGACRIRFDQVDPRSRLRILGGRREGPCPGPLCRDVPAPVREKGNSSPTSQEAGSGRASKLLQIDATVVGEVVMGGLPEAGNLIAGLPFVAGSALRGALAARWRGDRAGEDFLRCFLSGGVRFGFLYPPSAQAASRPVPLAKHTCKIRPGPKQSFGHGFVDLLLEPEIERCQHCGARLIPWGPRFEGAGKDVAARLALSPHNRIQPESQTVREDGLFAYEALPEGTRLRGFIEAGSADDTERLLAGLGLAVSDSFPLRVGRRKGALGYLDCRVSAFAGRPGGTGLYPNAAPVPDEWPASGYLRIDLVTPALVADEHLRFRESLVPGDLGLARPKFDEAFSSFHLLAGWNSTHRLPKSDQLAVAAGSSFLLVRPENGAEEELKTLQRAAREGIGLRRNEGFGVILIQETAAPEPRRESR